MPIWPFLSEVPAVRTPSFDDSAATETVRLAQIMEQLEALLLE
jgi:hypothetical protein